jgi:hypothetical protein
MVWIMLPFGIILILITAMLLAGSMLGKAVRCSQEQPHPEELEERIR